jgi:hypothetical protein
MRGNWAALKSRTERQSDEEEGEELAKSSDLADPGAGDDDASPDLWNLSALRCSSSTSFSSTCSIYRVMGLSPRWDLGERKGIIQILVGINPLVEDKIWYNRISPNGRSIRFPVSGKGRGIAAPGFNRRTGCI